MTKQEIINGYLESDRPYNVCIHTTMGGYMEFCMLERGLMFEENAKMVCDSYAETMRTRKNNNFKSVCVRNGSAIVYEVNL